MEAINEKYIEFGNPGNAFTKCNILSENIYGVDIDPQAVELAKLNLLIYAVDEQIKLPNLAKNIEVGNSLIESGGKSNRPFSWKDEYKNVFDEGGFDIVVGNPPYLKEKDNKDIFEPVKRSRYKKYYQGKMDFWYFFLHRAIDICKVGGYIGFITNSYFLKNEGASKLIDRIRNELVLVKAVDLDDIKVFGDVSGKHIIHIYQKRKPRTSDKTLYASIDRTSFTGNIELIKTKTIPYAELFTSGNKISFETNGGELFDNCVALGDAYDVSQGIVEAPAKISNKQAANSKTNAHKAGEGVFVISDQELTELTELNVGPKGLGLIKKYLNANNVHRYYYEWSNENIIYADKEAREEISQGKHPEIKGHLDTLREFITSSNKPYGLHRPRERKYFQNPKLLCKGMFLRPEFCYDDQGYCVGFSFSVIIQKDKNYSLKFLLAVLNSKLGEHWFNINGKKRGVGVDIGVAVFRQFPVHSANATEQKQIEVLVNKMLKLQKEHHAVTPDTDKWEILKSEIANTDDQIDQMVYKLYDLAPEEIKTVENSAL